MAQHSDEQRSSPEELRQRLTCACPKCAQWLALRDDQLDAAEGWVRCSSCDQVFLALACLLDAKSVEGAELLDADQHQRAYSNTDANAPNFNTSVLNESSSSVSSGNAPRPINIDEFLRRQAVSKNQKAGVSDPVQGRETSPAWEALEHAMEEVRVHPRAPTRRSWVYWAVGLFIFLVLLPLAFTFRFRNEVAALYPGLKSPLVQMCQWLPCQVEWPRDLSALSIESSSLEKEEPNETDAQPNALGKNKPIKFHLSLRIKNSFSYPLAVPQIKLTLLDEKDQVLLEQRLAVPLKEEAPVIKPGALNQFLLPIEWDPSQSRLPSGYRVELE